LIVLAGCASTAKTASASGTLRVVAAENFWGSIAAQLGGSHVHVTSIIANPAADPHDYEPTPDDGTTVATANYVIANGLGYDQWLHDLLDANPVSGRVTLDVGDITGHQVGDNPHRWYFPGDVHTVIAHITDDYKRLDPAHAADFESLRRTYESNSLHDYDAALADIRQRYAGVAVGASESIFDGLAQATGLNLVTPASFLDAISEGREPTAQDKTTVDQQLTDTTVKVFVYNSQNSTPDVQRLVDEANQHHIPVTTVTETLTPSDATFQDWQTTQLHDLATALATATGH
jgi:zinc/manganese transport system substrate-binding protein